MNRFDECGTASGNPGTTREEQSVTENTATEGVQTGRVCRMTETGSLAQAVSRDAIMSNRPVEVEVTGKIDPEHLDQPRSDQTGQKPKPLLTKAGMMEAFRKEWHLRKTISEPERVLDSIVAADGPGTLIRDILTKPNAAGGEETMD